MAGEIENVFCKYSEIEQMAKAITQAKVVDTVEKAITLMLLAQSEGKHPMAALLEYDLILVGGTIRPTLRATAMLTRFQQAGGCVKWEQADADAAVGVFSHPQGGSLRVRWDYAKAEQAKLTLKSDSMYKKYPAAMFRSRCIAEGIRAVFPGATNGMYTAQELSGLHMDGMDGIVDIEQSVKTPIPATPPTAAAMKPLKTLTNAKTAAHITAMKEDMSPIVTAFLDRLRDYSEFLHGDKPTITQKKMLLTALSGVDTFADVTDLLAEVGLGKINQDITFNPPAENTTEEEI